jgi:UDP-N-acetylmuramate--alanine ligase
MLKLLDFEHIYLVGIKGVAMTSLAQCLLDAGVTVSGSDVAEDFVTKDILKKRGLKIDIGFDTEKVSQADAVVYTAAHGGPSNPQVVAAIAKNTPTFSHAEALSLLFNDKQGVAVCGVGGKSTTSAMITWILEKTATEPTTKPSFAVGVGNIPGLDKTGQWNPDSQVFIAEADEYVTDPQAPKKGDKITPRFSFLNPQLTVCTNLKFDHPDVYLDFAHTTRVYAKFFTQIKTGGKLIINSDDQNLLELAKTTIAPEQITTYGSKLTSKNQSDENLEPNFFLKNFSASPGQTTTKFTHEDNSYQLQLQIPGQFNAMNALAAIAVCEQLEVSITDSIQALSSFSSTKRRAEYIGEKNGVKYYDDYAHHPNEVKSIIKAFQEWYPDRRLVIAFQSHTFSRTKQLFAEFVDAFATTPEVVMIDIFPSAREEFDPSVTSDLLCQEISQKYPAVAAINLKTISALVDFCRSELQAGDILLTVGAGDIYLLHDQINS